MHAMALIVQALMVQAWACSLTCAPAGREGSCSRSPGAPVSTQVATKLSELDHDRCGTKTIDDRASFVGDRALEFQDLKRCQWSFTPEGCS